MAEHMATHAQSAKFTGRAFADTSDHPLQRKLTFVFTDYKPNGNNQGVPPSEANNVATSALYMPVKINFNGEGPQGHKGAEPIGPIVKMTPSDKNIVGEAIVWIDEFPEIDTFLKTASAEEEGVQFSWELYFSTSETDDKGIQWLHGITTAGIAIVENPAYQGRTPLIAIAEGSTMELDDLKKQVSDLSDKLWSMLDALYAALALPGAVDKSAGIEAQFTSVIDALKSMASKVVELEAQASNNDAFVVLETEVTQLRTFKAQIESAAQKQTILAERREKLETSGIKLTDEQFDSRADRIVEMSDDVFGFYVADLASLLTASAAQGDKAIASKVAAIFPDPMTQNQTNTSIKDLATAFRSARMAQEIK